MSNFRKKIEEKIDNIGENENINKIQQAPNKLVKWAENNRKKMFAITIAFLVFSFLVTLITCICNFQKRKNAREETRQLRENLREQKIERQKDIRNDILDYKKYREYEDEINELLQKDSLTKEDSIRVTQLYNLIISEQNEKN